MKVAVTGGSGQLGTLVLRRLVNDRRVEAVVSLDRRPPLLTGRKLTSILADVREPDFARYLAGCDVLIHLAFIVDRFERRSVMDDVNVQGSKNVFRAGAAAGIGKLIHLSSAAAFGVLAGHPSVLSEDSARRHQPVFAYAANKQAVEAFLDEFEGDHPNIALVRLRPVMLIGRHMDNIMGRMLRRRRLPYCSDVPVPVVWDEDVADAVTLALHQPLRGTFNLAAEDPISARELAAADVGLRALAIPKWLGTALAHVSPLLAKARIAPSVDPAWIANSDVRLVLSSEKAKAILGWRPQCATAIDVMRRFCATAPGRLDPRIRTFLLLAGLAGRFGPRSWQLRGVHMKIHLALEGAAGGDVCVAVEDGRLLITNAPPRPPTAVVAVNVETFRKILSGRLDWAAAQLTGRVSVTGEAAALLVIAGMVSAFRARTTQHGPANVLARAVGRWVTSGGGR